MNKIKAIIILGLALILASCAGNKDNASRKIVVSIPPQRYIVGQLMGTDVPVRTLMDSNSNPETFEPGMGSMMDLMECAVYFKVGTLDFEKRLVESVSARKGNVNVVNTSEGIELLYGTHDGCGHDHEGHHHEGNVPDPHVWSTPANMKIMASNMAESLVGLFPEKKDSIMRNLVNFNLRMDSADMRLRHVLVSAATDAFMVWHPSYSYLAKEYGMEQIAVGANVKEYSVRNLAERIGDASKRNVKVLFIQKEFDPAQAASVAARDSVIVVPVNPMNGDWENEFETVVKAFE